MRTFAIVVVALASLVFAALSVIGYKLLHAFPEQRGVEAPSTAPPKPSPYDLKVSRAEQSGWTLLMSWRPRDEGGPASCAEAHRRFALPTVTDAGRSTVTLKVVPGAGQEVVLTAVRVRFVSTAPAQPAPHHLVHCPGTGDHRPLLVRAEGREGEVVDTGTASQRVSPNGLRQDIAVEVTGTRTATWQVEADMTLDGVPVTQVVSKGEDSGPLVTEPLPADVAGHVVWCDHALRDGSACR
ncbi:hypothetical protein [Lentzea sp. NPDC055074]